MPMKHPQNHTREDGFTMVVIAALFIAFAVIAAAAIERNTTTQQITRRDATIEQLNRLSNAIIEYSVFNKAGTVNLYPCPARLDLALDDVSGNFGKSVTNCWDTTGDVVGPPAMTSSNIYIVGTSVVRGMVPVVTLSQYGININDAFDPWNNRIMYVVNRRLTLASTTSAGAQADNPTLTDRRTAYTLSAPDFLLISYGRDGKGGFNRSGTSETIACPAASAVLREENCDTDTSFNVAPTYISANATAATYFDDILTYYRQ